MEATTAGSAYAGALRIFRLSSHVEAITTNLIKPFLKEIPPQ
jgi:hypothetical protein